MMDYYSKRTNWILTVLLALPHCTVLNKSLVCEFKVGAEQSSNGTDSAE